MLLKCILCPFKIQFEHFLTQRICLVIKLFCYSCCGSDYDFWCLKSDLQQPNPTSIPSKLPLPSVFKCHSNITDQIWQRWKLPAQTRIITTMRETLSSSSHFIWCQPFQLHPVVSLIQIPSSPTWTWWRDWQGRWDTLRQQLWRHSTGLVTMTLAQVVLWWSQLKASGSYVCLAIDWLCDRSQSTYETSLEDEVSEVRSELDRRHKELMEKAEKATSLSDNEEDTSDDDDEEEKDKFDLGKSILY